MRILHTADWHIGKKLGRIDRRDEVEKALDELVGIADSNDVDAVLVAGDLFDRGTPPLDSLRLVLDALTRLAAGGRKVVAIPGNHDSPELFKVLAPLLDKLDITLVHKPLRPDEGGIVTVPSRDGSMSARVACVPFIHEAFVIDVMEAPEQGYKSYADRIRAITRFYADWMVEHPDPKAVDLLMGHFMVHGAVPGGSERELHIGEAYMANADAIPPDLKYAALGHIHLAQDAPGSATPARFCGSLLQLDFGEVDQDKSVCIVDVEPGMRPARVECIPMTSGRKLVKVTDTLEALRARAADFGDAWLHVVVKTEGPEPGLADEVRSFLPNALQVYADYEREDFIPQSREGRTLAQLYSDYVTAKRGVEPPPPLAEAFERVAAEVGAHL